MYQQKNINVDLHINVKTVLERLLEMSLIEEYEYLKAVEKLCELIS